jgi:tRNA nucleotidyltransferase/poly(A) polymerase
VPQDAVKALPPDGWIVGGAVRDSILGRPVTDIDLVVPGDPEVAARAFAESVRKVAVFGLNDDFGAWRVIHHDDRWQVDFNPLNGGSIEADLAQRDFTANAIAEEIGTGARLDPTGGEADIERRLLAAVSPDSFKSDPLRVLRMTRIGRELGFTADADTLELARSAAPGLADVAGERNFMEFARVLAGPNASEGIRDLDRSGALAAIFPELLRLKGIEQSDFHHLDCWGHTLLVLDEVERLEADPADLGPAGHEAAEILNAELADGQSRWLGLRLAALLHDIAKPDTRVEFGNGRIGFPGHDDLGAEVSDAFLLGRLKSSARLAAFVRAEIVDHLTAGFLTHEEPVGLRDVHRYLLKTGQAAVDTTVISVADRLATRGRNSEVAIEKHLSLTSRLLAAAVEREREGDADPLVRGDALATSLGIAQGPQLGDLLAELAAAQYAREISTEEEAIEHARSLLAAE